MERKDCVNGSELFALESAAGPSSLGLASPTLPEKMNRSFRRVKEEATEHGSRRAA